MIRAKILRILLFLSFTTLVIGPLGMIPIDIPGVNIYLADIVLLLMIVVWIMNIFPLINLLKKEGILFSVLPFMSIALFSLIFSPIILTLQEKAIAFLYFIRFVCYFFYYITVVYLLKLKILKKSEIIHGLTISGLLLATFGWLQYFFYPDLRNLFYLGWDPHYKRIFGSYLDANYLGIILTLTLTLLFIKYKSKAGIWLARFGIFLTLMFTYSRSSYLALTVAGIIYLFAKGKVNLLKYLILVIFVSALILPRPSGESVKLERVFSLEQRLINWEQGFRILSQYPLVGIGFNTVRFAKFQYGYLESDYMTNHAGAGFDNSFLFVGVTTGLIGLAGFIYFLGKIYQRGGLLTKITLGSIIVHSLFLNTLFWPWVLQWLMLITAIDVKDDK
ncbi:hypothetical protein A2960_01295 [Candidatus Gottesmanbacteria bacterium RIFCSPLOWO2_01_FULL_39_12b]|uniref:O-antigen ligase-related domain-containing protein n=1 Tax=Candidatus Gottesmanbacteria bacterium RIFCSPLOWO2_01_FULL_39_12b TaxID=1798388 RepID=A0A1F6AQ46_9BACT|nr:MAG: hypothetical protein A2960_01295 [Candidatus Gottesmanbacteria bacterium RIFCSPLOWO2_01_FULL_39_12b]